MSTKKNARGLGNAFMELGIDSLLKNIEQKSKNKIIQNIKLSDIVIGKYQPRLNMEQSLIDELAKSIKAHGVINPILVREIFTENNELKYEIIAGERRFRASQSLDMATIPAIVEKFSDNEASCIALIENIQRENLNVMEEALALSKLCQDFSMTHQDIAEKLGKSRSAITNTLRLLDLNTKVQDLVLHSNLDMGHARALLALKGEDQEKVAQKIIKNGFSVRETENIVRRLKNPQESKSTKILLEAEKVKALQNKLRASKINIQKNDHKYKISFAFSSEDDLQKLIDFLLN